MKVLVPVKRVIDANIKVRVKSDQSGVELNNVKMAMNLQSVPHRARKPSEQRLPWVLIERY